MYYISNGSARNRNLVANDVCVCVGGGGGLVGGRGEEGASCPGHSIHPGVCLGRGGGRGLGQAAQATVSYPQPTTSCLLSKKIGYREFWNYSKNLFNGKLF